MQDKCREKKQKVPTNVAEAVQLAQELIRLAEVLVNTEPSSKATVVTEGDNAG